MFIFVAKTSKRRLQMPTGLKTFDLPINQESAFSNHKNIYKRRLEKQQTKFLNKLTPIKPFFKEGEKILLVAPACSPMTLLEQFLAGYWIFYIKRAILIFTDRRILHIPTKSDYSYKNSIAQIMHGDLQEINLKGKSLICKYKAGKKETFHSVGVNLKKIKTVIESISIGGPMSDSKRRTHICPRCGAQLQKNKYVCPKCRLIFKNKKEATKISWIYPGGGYFYVRHPFLGVFDAITEIALLTIVVAAFIILWGGDEAAAAPLVIFGFALAYEKLITVYEAKHFIEEYIPVDTNFRVQIAGK